MALLDDTRSRTRSTPPSSTPSSSPVATQSCTTSRQRALQRLTREIFEAGGVVSSVCHGYCGLLNTEPYRRPPSRRRPRADRFLLAGRSPRGRRQARAVQRGSRQKERGAHYDKTLVPFVSYAVVDGNLVTGQNPGSAKETAEKIVEVLKG